MLLFQKMLQPTSQLRIHWEFLSCCPGMRKEPMNDACLLTDAAHPATAALGSLLASRSLDLVLHGFDGDVLEERARQFRARGAASVTILRDDRAAPRSGRQVADDAQRGAGPLVGCVLAPSSVTAPQSSPCVMDELARNSQLQELLFQLGTRWQASHHGWLFHAFPQNASPNSDPLGGGAWLFSLVSALAVEWRAHAVQVSSLSWPANWEDWCCEEAMRSWSAAASELMKRGRLLSHWHPPSVTVSEAQGQETCHD